MSNFFTQAAANKAAAQPVPAGPRTVRQPVFDEAFRRILERKQREEAEALRALQAKGEEAAIYNRSALAVGASQAQQHARALADAALTTPSEKPEIVTGTQAKRKRGGVTIRI